MLIIKWKFPKKKCGNFHSTQLSLDTMKKPKAKWFHSRIEIGVNLLLNGQNMFRTRMKTYPILSIICKASYHSIILSSHHPIILSSCHPVIPPTGHLVIQSPCHPVIIVISSCHPIIMPSCLPVILLSWKISHLDMMPKSRYQTQTTNIVWCQNVCVLQP